MLIDTHCHLYLPEFDEERRQAIERAKAAQVAGFYLPCIDSSTMDALLQMERDFPGYCFAMMGLHPCSVNADYTRELMIAEQWLQTRAFAAIGETGLDFYWDKTYIPQQYAAFRTQVNWAKQYRIPVVIHSRQSTRQCIDVITEMWDERLTGIFHCFGGSLEEAQQIIALGFYLGIGGVITYKNAGLAAVVAALPLNNIVLETDAPYLTPVPFRGKRNESAFLHYIAEKIALEKNMSVESVASITTANARKVFNCPQP